MKVFAIGDLHLPGGEDKPMDVFGGHWDGHFDRIRDAWEQSVGEEDVVLLPGDTSWAMKLDAAMGDLDAIAALKGTKIITRGNHDYWWTSLSKLRARLHKSMVALQNDSHVIGGVCFAGSRGWACPGSTGFGAHDQAIYERELARTRLSLQSAPDGVPIIAALHFPPVNERHQPSGFTELFREFKVKTVVYGHLHGRACKNAFEGLRDGVEYHLCSSDYLGFKPKRIL
ncbi:MAG: metallophosphoesterase [Bacillota bacterium]